MAGDEKNNKFEEELLDLKENCKMLFEADPSQAHSDASLRRFLRAFGNADDACKNLLKSNKWRREFGVESLSPADPDIQEELTRQKVTVLRHRDSKGRPIVYVAVRKHNVYERDIDKFTKFIVYILENACKKCHEDVIDNLCIVFDMKDFGMSCMDYQFVKNLIWLLSKHYPERLGVCLMINSPLVFTGCWAVIKPWLHEVTASKVVFVNSDQDLCQYFSPDILPED